MAGDGLCDGPCDVLCDGLCDECINESEELLLRLPPGAAGADHRDVSSEVTDV